MLWRVIRLTASVVLLVLGVTLVATGVVLFFRGNDGVSGTLIVTSKNCRPRFCVVEGDFRRDDGGPVAGNVVLDGGPHEVGDRVRAFYRPGDDAPVAHEEPWAWWMSPTLSLVGGLVAVGSAASLFIAGRRESRRHAQGPRRVLDDAPGHEQKGR